jgi:protein-S-isoprenylcysteine O-methyltransferase Ste14
MLFGKNKKSKNSVHVAPATPSPALNQGGLAAAMQHAIYLYVAVVLIPALFVAGSDYLTPIVRSAFSWTYFNIFPLNFVIFSFFFLAGAVWILWAINFRHARKGDIVTEGPYAYTRNPRGFGYLLILLGLAIMLQSAVAIFLLFPLTAVLFIVYIKLFEEPLLRLKHGASFDRYRQSVPLLFPLPPSVRRRLQ